MKYTYKNPHTIRLIYSIVSNGKSVCNGFSYVEVLVAISLIAITLLPALESLSTGVQSSTAHTAYEEETYLLESKMEEVLADAFSSLEQAAVTAGNPATATTYSDVITLANGRQVTRNVFISAYDGDNADNDNDPFTGVDVDLLWIRVEIPDSRHVLETLTTP